MINKFNNELFNDGPLFLRSISSEWPANIMAVHGTVNVPGQMNIFGKVGRLLNIFYKYISG